MKNKEDIIANADMFFQQIKELADLMIENNNISIPNLITFERFSTNRN